MNDSLFHLNKVNEILHQIEKELVVQAKACLKIAEKKLRAKNTFTTDYEVEVAVSFFTERKDDSIHIFTGYFKYDDLITKKDYSLSLTKNWDWRETYMPMLNKPYCFMLHDLIDHTNLGKKIWTNKKYQISTIWIDIIYSDQKAIDIDEDGNTKHLKWNKTERAFQ